MLNEEYNLNHEDVIFLVSDKKIANYYENVLKNHTEKMFYQNCH